MLFSLIFGNLFIVLLISAYRLRYPKDSASSFFVLSKWLQAASWSGLTLLTGVPSWLSLPLVNLLMLAGGCLELIALLMMMGMFTRRVKHYYVFLAAASTLTYGIIFIFNNESNLRIASASFWTALFIVYPAYHLSADKHGTPLQKIMGSLYYIIAFSMLGRGIAALTASGLMTVFTPNVVQQLYYIGMYMFLILGTAGFILLSKEQSYEDLKKVATYDELTGILNRRSFIIQAQQKITTAVKNMERVSLMVLDIDHFKQVNDTYGHDTGDKVLTNFARVIQQNLDQGDLFGRFGGEEFTILLGAVDEVECDRKAELLRKAVMDVVFPGISLKVTVSIGVVTLVPNRRTPLDMLYKLSDKALYRAKLEGRNRVVRGRWL